MRYYKSDICEKLLRECPDNIERAQAEELTAEQFVERYEKDYKPVVIQNITKEWHPRRYWTFEVTPAALD